ncbi:hypothetical protein C2845_PM11G17400 [Panicum miliaceum]|uniref:Uncharacterized protein n=1 Tax=Panicum miliaceum TaxID=4540 RepID=A0A3L6RTC4_PANMI|nr:hypothetical protein C2845_PM11G17400 [Panicum miliaceum]
MAAAAVAARSRALASAVSSSLRRGCLPVSRRGSCITRLPLVSGGLLSALPLHSAVASARLRSAIASESRSWCLVPQGAVIAYMLFGGPEMDHEVSGLGGAGNRSCLSGCSDFCTLNAA